LQALSLPVISDIQETHNLCQKWRDKGESIAFVPTMGCLHAGHLSLIEKAQSLADHVVVSIFVNPLQFDNADDFLKYPHTLTEDVRKLAEIKVDLVFTPESHSFYPEGEKEVKQVELGGTATLLEGAQRPGHFAGVATVVKRLFELILPNVAIFGEKDFQQLLLIKQLVDTFSLDIEIIGMPTFREQDGLAMSSRNVRLTENERQKAPEIYRQLESIKAEIKAGSTDFAELERTTCENLVAAGFVPEYVAIREISTLLTPQNRSDSMVILIAAKLGKIRLIDNLRV
jgi:pantoate--beta-alanine ligase